MTSTTRRGPLFLASLTLAALAGCAQPGAAPVIWDKTHMPTIDTLTIDGRCSLVISGTVNLKDKAVARTRLDIERGIAHIEVDLAQPDSWTSQTFHVVVPVEEQRVAVIYVGENKFPVWERGAGGKTCAN
jgi:hypothetical protein